MWTGAAAPPLELDGIREGKRVRFDLAARKGKWTVVAFYPADFSFICPTEVMGFSSHAADFATLGAEVVCVSVDPVETHESWSRELGGVGVALLSDPDGESVKAWGATDPGDPPRALRATYVVDPKGVIAWAMASSRNVGRSVDETLRTVAALQTGRMCPAGWKPGDPTGEPAR
jgi:peroxiredoxin (alkyl hydroperoxide reductase subunit C)